MGQVVGNQDGVGYRTVEAVAPVNADGQIIGSASAPVQVAATTAIPTTDSLGGTRAFNWANNVREAFTTSSTAAIALPTLGTSRELRIHTSVRAFIRFGASNVSPATVAAGQMISPADVPDVIRIPTGQTHVRVIGETASGSISLTAVV